jgi:hypothetical protein
MEYKAAENSQLTVSGIGEVGAFEKRQIKLVPKFNRITEAQI